MPELNLRTILALYNAGAMTPIGEDDPIPAKDAAALAALIQLKAVVPDTGESEYTPGLTPLLVTAAGPTPVYTSGGPAFRIRAIDAIPVVRGTENAPVITIKVLNSDDTLFRTLYIAAAISKRKLVTCPAGAKVVVSLDIAGRVPVTFDIEEI